MAMNLKKDLQDVNKALDAISKKVEKMIGAVGKVEKPAVSAKPAKKAASKKLVVKTAPAIVLEIIKRSKKGISIETLKEKTGYKAQKLHSTVYTLKKQGKIKAEKKGFYEKV